MKLAERQHYGLAVMCARRFLGRGVEMEDLISEAEAALLWAASRFDESRGVRFSTYAIPVALGALRQLCRQSAPMHVPRSDIRLLAQAQAVRERLFQFNGHEPDVCAIASAMGVEAVLLAQVLSAAGRMGSAAPLQPGQEGPNAAEPGFEDAVLLRDAVKRLPAPMGQVIWLRYGMGLTQQETARRLACTQPQISRWEKKGKEMLRQIND